MPKRVKMKTEAGKFETYYIDRRIGTAHKVLRSTVSACKRKLKSECIFLTRASVLVNKQS